MTANRRITRQHAGQIPANVVLRAARKVRIDIPELTATEVVRRSLQHYNARNPNKRPATVRSDARFVARLCVNWLRHDCSQYDTSRTLIRDSTVANEAGEILKKRTLTAIAEAYPWLSAECVRQTADRSSASSSAPY